MPLSASGSGESLGENVWLIVACVVVLLALVALAYSITRRRSRTSGLPELPLPPRPFPVPLVEPLQGYSLGTVFDSPAGDPAAQGDRVLGETGPGQLTVTCVGVDIAGLWLPRALLRSVRTGHDPGSEGEPSLLIGWQRGGVGYLTGFHPQAPGYQEVMSAVEGLLARERSESSSARPKQLGGQQ